MRRARASLHAHHGHASSSSRSPPRGAKRKVGGLDDAATKYRKAMLGRYTSGQITDKGLAEISYLARKANGRGLEDVEANPESKGRNDARKVRSGLGVTPQDMVDRNEVRYIDVPMWNAWRNKREIRSLMYRPPDIAMESHFRHRQGP